MQDTSPRRTRIRSLRTTVLIIGLVPGLLLLAGGLGLGTYLVTTAMHEQQRSAALSAVAEQATKLITALREERRTSERLASPGAAQALDRQRNGVDDAAQTLLADGARLPSTPSGPVAAMAELRGELDSLTELRRRVDASPSDLLATAEAYDHLQDDAIALIDAVARASGSPRAAEERTAAEFLNRSADLLARATSAAGAAITPEGISSDARTYVLEQSGAYDAELAELAGVAPRLGAEELATFEALRSSPQADTLAQARAVLARSGDGAAGDDAPAPPSAPIDVPAFDSAATTVVDGLQDLGTHELVEGDHEDEEQARAQVRDALLLAGLLLALAGAVLAVALLMANRLVKRLAALRDDTLRRAEHDLPEAVARVRAGRGHDVEATPTRHGDDEIGEVAAAFDRAQQTALRAAAGEAAARAGFATVFLNIAHRSQGIVHRQLKVLDEAERAEADPDQLARLFQLDHLATRERRNAENLIILGGGTPGRQWREPVPLIELVRSAVSETVHYNRVEHGRLPAVPIVGPAVADLVHLLAELLDNATAFSPPETRIQVRGNLVGRGLVIEIEDQGLGVPAEQREELNALLADPPDFGVLTLSEETRLGLFVVAQLAHRHDVRITLLESAYGGIRAVVLVPAALLAGAGDPADDPTADLLAHSARSAPVTVGAAGRASRVGASGAASSATGVLGGTGADAVAGDTALREAPRATDPARPALPRRRRQDHLAPQLADQGADEDAAGPGLRATDTEAGRPADGEHAERSRQAFGALQRGTRDARGDDDGRDRAEGGREGGAR